MKAHELTGKRFGKLTVVRRGENNSQNKAVWVCKCDCGEITTAITAQLNNGHKRSCGCLQSEYARMRATEFPIRSGT